MILKELCAELMLNELWIKKPQLSRLLSKYSSDHLIARFIRPNLSELALDRPFWRSKILFTKLYIFKKNFIIL